MERIITEEEASIIKEVAYDILCQIKKICEKNSIGFFLIGGSALGAVRHNGIIPWDDDIDIGMLRKDYIKFCEIAPKELPEYLKVVNFDTTKGMGEPFTKVMDIRGKMVEAFTENTSIPKGVFVDVFPVDKVPLNKLKRYSHRYHNYLYRKLILLDAEYNFNKKGIKKVFYEILKKYARIIGRDKLIKKYERNAIKYQNAPNEEYVILASNYGYEAEIADCIAFENVEWMKFEKEMFPVPSGWDRYLRRMYGDYMKFPPEEKRVNKHTLVELDLTSYMKLSGDDNGKE